MLTFAAITLFYFFESAQMAYFNVLAPSLISSGAYHHAQIAAISAAYYYGDMVGLFPVGWALDRLPLRKTLIFAIIGSLVGTFLLFSTDNFFLQFIARFISGFFGGTFAFLGGIRLIALLFPKRFSYYIGLFLAAGMFGGLICQYPLLVIVNHFGPDMAMKVVFLVGVLVVIFNFLYLKPKEAVHTDKDSLPRQPFLTVFREIVFNLRNLTDVIMVFMLDTPVSVIGTLWGVVLFMGFFHFSPAVSSWVVMSLFAGLMLGLPVWGKLADALGNRPWMIATGAGISFIITLLLFAMQSSASVIPVMLLLFVLGFFSSVQSIGFSWLTKNMKPELIGRNSAYNSVIFMGSNGAIKQLGGFMLGLPAILLGSGSAANLLLIIAITMLLATIYPLVRPLLYRDAVY